MWVYMLIPIRKIRLYFSNYDGFEKITDGFSYTRILRDKIVKKEKVLG